MTTDMLYVHWILCFMLGYAGFLRCLEIDPKANVLLRTGTAGIPVIAVWLGFRPEDFNIEVNTISAVMVLALLLGVVGELNAVRSALEGGKPQVR